MNPIIPEKYQDRVDYLLMILVVLAAIIRFWQLDAECLWIDEAWSYFVTQQPWHLIPFMDVHPPVYYWLTKLWLSLPYVIPTEGTIRMVSALAGVLTVPFVYLLGKRIGNDFVGMVAAFLMAFSTFAIYYSQEARQYAVVTLFFCIFLLVYLDAIERKNWKRWAFAGALAALCMYTHWFLFFAIGATVFHAMYFNRKEIANVFIYVCTIFTLMLPAIPMLDKAIYTKVVLEGSNLLEGLHGLDIIGNTLTWAGQNIFLFGAVLLVLAGYGWLVTWNPNKDRDSISMLIVFLFVTHTIAMLLLAEYVVVFERYFLFLLPLFYVMVAVGLISLITALFTDRTTIAIIIVFFLAIFGAATLTYYDPVYKPDMRNTFDPLYPITSDGDVHAITANQGQFELIKFYYRPSVAFGHVDLVRFSSVRDLWDIMQEHPSRSMFVWVPPVEVPEGLTEASRIDSFLQQYGTKEGEIHQGSVHYAVYRVPYMREPFVSPPPLKSDFDETMYFGLYRIPPPVPWPSEGVVEN